jgi:hypothetical protein
MDYEAYSQYQLLWSKGRKKEANKAAKQFVDSFSNLQEKREWAVKFLETTDMKQPTNQQIYSEIIFPVLKDGYNRREPWSIKWLIKTTANLYRSPVLLNQFGDKTAATFAEEYLALVPEDQEMIEEYLRIEASWLAYCVHEWPVGILIGNDGANLGDCFKIQELIRKMRKMDTKGNHETLLFDVEGKVKEYVERLKRNINHAI